MATIFSEKTLDLSLIFEKAPIGICIVKHSGWIIEANNYLSKLTGLSQKELKEKRIHDLIQYQESFGQNNETYVKLNNPHYEDIWVKIGNNKHQAPKHDSYAVFLTEVNSYNQIQKQLQKKNDELKDFAYIASHDLKEPLRTIKNYINLLHWKTKNEEKQLNGKAQEYLEHIQNASERMQDLIEDLLEYARANQTLSISQNNLLNIVEEAINHMDSPISKSNTQIKMENLNLDVVCDKIKIMRVFQNLISNSIKYVKENQSPTITIQGKHEGNNLQVLFKDNSVGIPENNQEKIFNMMESFNTKMDKHHSGNGIGLAVSKRIIERHEGNIYVESEWGEGSTFIINIPNCKIS